MPNKDIDKPAGSAIELIRGASTLAERQAAGRAALGLVQLPTASVPVPRFLGDLPWSDDNDQVIEQIIVNLITAEDIETASEGNTPLKADDVLGQWVTLHDLRVRESDVEDADWRAYMSLDVELGDGRRLVLNCGAKQVMATLWRVYVDGMLPILAKFVSLGESTKARKAPLGVIVQSKVTAEDGSDAF